MAGDKKVRDLMIPLEDYPHIPYWFTLRQAMAIIREASIKFEKSFEPRSVLVFDEKYRLMGMLTMRDIIRGLEPEFLRSAGPVKGDPGLAVLAGLFGPGLQEKAKTQVSEVMSPIKVTVNAHDPLSKALALMMTEQVERLPVMQEDKVAGIIRLSELFVEIASLVLSE
jgi:CBS domain-containing protein